MHCLRHLWAPCPGGFRQVVAFAMALVFVLLSLGAVVVAEAGATGHLAGVDVEVAATASSTEPMPVGGSDDQPAHCHAHVATDALPDAHVLAVSAGLIGSMPAWPEHVLRSCGTAPPTRPPRA